MSDVRVESAAAEIDDDDDDEEEEGITRIACCKRMEGLSGSEGNEGGGGGAGGRGATSDSAMDNAATSLLSNVPDGRGVAGSERPGEGRRGEGKGGCKEGSRTSSVRRSAARCRCWPDTRSGFGITSRGTGSTVSRCVPFLFCVSPSLESFALVKVALSSPPARGAVVVLSDTIDVQEVMEEEEHNEEVLELVATATRASAPVS